MRSWRSSTTSERPVAIAPRQRLIRADNEAIQLQSREIEALGPKSRPCAAPDALANPTGAGQCRALARDDPFASVAARSLREYRRPSRRVLTKARLGRGASCLADGGLSMML